MRQAGTVARTACSTFRATALGLAVLVGTMLAPAALPALAQVDPMQAGAIVRVANTDGQRLNLRAGPAVDQPIIARLPVGETLTVTGSSRVAGATRWLPVRTATGEAGWVAAEFVVLVSSPVPAPPAVAGTTPPTTTAGSETGPTERTNLRQREEAKGRAVDVEAKLKFPEVNGREQEITVWVTRDGAPVVGAIVTLESSDGDEGDRFRQLDPTNEEGRTRRSFDVRHEKGTVELQVEAVAPDGGEGRVIVSYFKR